MLKCPNKSTNEWRHLVETLGETNAYKVYLANNEEIPTGILLEEFISIVQNSFIFNIDYTLKSVDILLSDKAKQIFAKGEKANWDLNKILTELAIPKEQKALLLDIGSKDRETLALKLAGRYSYSVEVNTAKRMYDDEAHMQYEGDPTSYYSSLTVPGGTNYTENEISTPLITPSIKGHAQFSTDNGIGWFRSDDKVKYGSQPIAKTLNDIANEKYITFTAPLDDGGDIVVYENKNGHWYNNAGINVDLYAVEMYNQSVEQRKNGISDSKTRRILELQSDLFQKGRNVGKLDKFTDEVEWNEDFLNQGEEMGIENMPTPEEIERRREVVNKQFDTKENQFLQLLNKDSNWVTFFIKSIIQDSAKKGYEKVLFPKGETAAKIEGHETIADEIRRIDKEIASFKEDTGGKIILGNPNTFEEKTLLFKDNQEKDKFISDSKNIGYTDVIDIAYNQKNTLEQLQQQKDNLKSQGFEKLKPIEAFYEIKVGNVLEKQFGKDSVKTITDEYGNQWREISIEPQRDFNTILLQKIRPVELEEYKNKYIKEFDKAIQYLKLDETKEYTNEQFINKLKLLKRYNTLLGDNSWVKFSLTRVNGSLPNLYKIRLDDVKDHYQRISNNPEIAKQNATVLLDKLKEKFNINWEFNTDIKQMGLYNSNTNTVWINPNLMHSDTLFHEFAHPFIVLLQQQNPTLYKALNDEINGSTALKEVKTVYPELTEEQQIHEAIVQRLGELSTGKVNVFKKFINWISIKLRQLFNKNILTGLSVNTTLQELSELFTNPALSIDLSKVKINEIKEARVKNLNTQKEIVDRILFEQSRISFNEEEHKYVDAITGTVYKSVTESMYSIPGYGTVVKDEDEDEVLSRAARAGSVIHAVASSYFTNENKEAYQNVEDKDKIDISDKAKQALIDNILKDPKFKGQNIKILSEIMVSDKENGVAGTIDLIVVDERGRVFIYDFKTSESGKVFKWYNKAFNAKKQKPTAAKHNLQLSMYANMLKQYGIVADTKGIVKVRYSLDGNTISNVWLEKEYSDSGTGFDNMSDDNEDYKKLLYYRNEVIIEGDERLASLKKQAIRTLEENISLLEKQNKTEAADKLSRIAQELFELNNDSAITHFISQAMTLISKTKARLQGDIENGNLKLESLKNYSSYATGFDILDDLKDWAIESNKEDIATLINSIIGDKNYVKNAYEYYGKKLLLQTLKPEFNKVRIKYRNDAIVKYNKLSPEEKQKITKSEFINQELAKLEDQISLESEEVLKQELDKASSDISTLGRWVMTLGSTKDSIVGPLMRIINRNITKARSISRSRLNGILEALNKLEDSTSNNTFTKMEDFYDFMLEKDENGTRTQNIVVKYNKKFRDLYSEFQNKLNEELNDNTNKYTYEKRLELRKEKTKEFWDTHAPISNKKAYSVAIENAFKQLVVDGKITQDELDLINNNRKKDGKQVDFSTYLNEDTVNIIVNTLSEVTKRHRNLKSEFVDTQWLKLEELRKQNPEDPKVVMYDMLLNTIADANALLDGNNRLGGYFQNRLPGILKDNVDQMKSNGVINTIKNSLKNATTVREDDTTRGFNSIDKTTGRKLQYLPIYYNNSISEKDQNYDLATIIFRFYSMAVDYNQKSQILPEVELTRILLNKRTLAASDKKGNPIFKSFSKNSNLGTEQATNGIAKNIAEQFSDFVDAIFYGQKEKEQGTINIPIINKEIDAVKLGQTLQNWVSLNLLGLNYVQAVNNVIVGETQQMIEALSSEYISIKNYRKGAVMYDKQIGDILNDVGKRKPSSMVNLLLNHFNIDSDDLDVTLKQNSKLQQVAKTSTVYWTMKSGEHFLKGRFLLGVLHEKIVHDKDGKVLGPAINYFYKDSNGNLKFDKDGIVSDFSIEDQLNLGLRVNEINANMHGAYGEMNWVAIQQGMFGRMALAYRRWIVPGLRRRFGKNNFNFLIDDYREGYYVTTGKFFSNLFKELRVFQTVAYTEEWNNLTDHQKANIKRFSIEFSVMISMLFIAAAMKDLGDDNKDDEWIAYWNYQASRMKTDMWFYSNPWEAIKLLKSPMAAVSTLESVGKLTHQVLTDPFADYKIGPHKGENKAAKDFYDLVPVYRQLYRNLIDEVSWLNK